MKKPDVELRLPADGAYVAVLRTATAGLAARLDFTLEEIEDARMAVGEAAALALEAAAPGADLHTYFWLAPGQLTVEVCVGAEHPATPDEDSFAWTVLRTLAEVSARTDDDRLAITLVATSSLGSQPPA
ncbi:anti-sigma factor [Nocardioides sp. Kera G14]|uniref:anti-sigma factor n=1 Tax=Nocardioides sp. Kera G14 TaxID=2884264 RepID=UPI001D109EE9|nr:anti-sigma factor [Nocardioides sp. Kera G14]UDY24688.1 anti-sigma factor [Nocardioides sp. Kera G14]